MPSAIFDGKLYDTEDATEIGSYSNCLDTSDFDHLYEALYRTESGRFFLYGKGGAHTKYSTPVPGGGQASGDQIRPLSDDEAYQWAEDHLSPDEVLNEFPDRVEKA